MLHITKLRILREGSGCRGYVMLTSVMWFPNFVCKFFNLFVYLFYCWVDVWVLNQLANHSSFVGKWRSVCTGWGESMIQGNCEDDHYAKTMRRLHSEISCVPELVKWTLWTSFEWLEIYKLITIVLSWPKWIIPNAELAQPLHLLKRFCYS